MKKFRESIEMEEKASVNAINCATGMHGKER